MRAPAPQYVGAFYLSPDLVRQCRWAIVCAWPTRALWWRLAIRVLKWLRSSQVNKVYAFNIHNVRPTRRLGKSDIIVLKLCSVRIFVDTTGLMYRLYVNKHRKYRNALVIISFKHTRKFLVCIHDVNIWYLHHGLGLYFQFKISCVEILFSISLFRQQVAKTMVSP